MCSGAVVEGAIPIGHATGAPSTSHPVDTVETSRRIAGWNSMSSNACRARAREISISAARRCSGTPLAGYAVSRSPAGHRSSTPRPAAASARSAPGVLNFIRGARSRNFGTRRCTMVVCFSSSSIHMGASSRDSPFTGGEQQFIGRTLRACAVGDDLRPPYRASRLSEEGRRSQCSRSPAPFGPQPRRQPQAHPDRGHLFGGRGPGTRSLHAAPSSFLPDQSQSRCPVADIAQPATHRTLDRDGEHPPQPGPPTRSGPQGRCAPPGRKASDSTRSVARPLRSIRSQASNTESI